MSSEIINKAGKIAAIMCDTTFETLWLPRLQWARSKNPSVSLKVRVGSGKKTYVRHPARTSSAPMDMVLTYGQKMVESKCLPHQALAWLSAIEMQERGYFDREFTLLNILSHTCLHEFSHVCQVLMGHRYAGSVHNEEFYRILDSAYEKGFAEKVRLDLHQRAMKQGIDLESVRHDHETNQQDKHCMGEIQTGQLYVLNHAPYPYSQHNPYKAIKKLRSYIMVESVSAPEMKLKVRPMMMTLFQP